MSTYYVDGAVGNDSNAGTSAGSGNAWATVGKALSSLGAGDVCNVKASATYSIGTGLTASTGSGGVVYSTKTRLVGYTTTPGDNGRATIKATAAIVGLTISGSGWSFENFVFDGNTGTGTQGVVFSGSGTLNNVLSNCLVKNWSAEGVYGTGGVFSLIASEVTGCVGTSGAVYLDPAIAAELTGCAIHDNTQTGIYQAGNGVTVSLLDCLIYNNSGATSDGAAFSGYPVSVRGCTIHNNGRDGLRMVAFHVPAAIRNNILTSNPGYGINSPGMTAAASDTAIAYNAYYGNGTAATSTDILPGPGDVTLTGLPYTNASGGDFSLNNTAGQGAACRAAAYPGVFATGLSTGYRDIGAVQHQDSGGGGGGTTVITWMEG